MDPSSLAQQIEAFLSKAPEAVVRERGEILFDLTSAKYSVSAERGRCMLQFWSEERNIVRRVLDATIKAGMLQLKVQRLGQPKPATLEIATGRSQRQAGPRAGARKRYLDLLQAALRRRFPDWTLEGFTAAMDLEHSFGPGYVRGIIRHGSARFAVVGVASDELPATVNGALTVAILWLDLCRQRETRGMIEGVRLFLPPGMTATTQTRMFYLNAEVAKWQLFTFAEDSSDVTPVSLGDHGNIATRLVHCAEPTAVQERFTSAIARIKSMVPMAEIVVRSEHEVAFCLHGLEFARATMISEDSSFRRRQQITFGSGANETELTAEREEYFRRLMRKVMTDRHADGDTRSRLWRMQPERWLESRVMADAGSINADFRGSPVYSQVPAFAAADRGMIDVLTCTRQGRLAVIELKADEDLHLPLQGLDYWARVKWHHAQPSSMPGGPGELQQFGYFAGRTLSPQPPLLYLAAPALRIHSATDIVLRYFSSKIDWTLIGIDERWRHELKVTFSKRSW